MKLFIMQFSQTYVHFIPFQPKYSPQHPVLKYLQFMLHTKSHPYKITGKIIFLHIFIFTFLNRRQDKRFWTEW
jgi:hypothetical protein